MPRSRHLMLRTPLKNFRDTIVLSGFSVLLVLGISTKSHAAADDMSVLVYDNDQVRATAYTDCDASAYVLVEVTEKGSAERYAAPQKFTDKIAPHASAILSATANWLDGDGADLCDTPIQIGTITLVGLVNALPVHVTGAARADAWAAGSAVPAASDIAVFADAVPAAEAARCQAFAESVGGRLDKFRTQIFTIRAAHTTGQWSHMQALTKLVPLHQEIMGLVSSWALDWQCPDIFGLASVAILADEERAALLKWNKQKISARVSDAATPEDVAAVMTELYRHPSLPPVSGFHDLAVTTDSGPTIRYGGYLSPNAEAAEAAFAGANP